ncbi:kinesin-like protein Klp5 [Tulasnella sp. 427]|nr:kinesin-like protein Klp5 [Tulasnella sp. 427]
MSQSASITVAVRVRPPTLWEQDRLPEPPSWNETLYIGDGNLASPRKVAHKNLRPVVQVMDDHVLIFDPKDPDVSRAFEQRGFLPPGAKRYKDQRYTFDRVFDEHARQIDVFENTTKPLLDGLFDGFNATVFAYGATGCGKTHTISGTEENPGIIYLTMAELFAKIEEKKDDMLVEVSLNFLEIYNEEIRDLLVDGSIPQPRGGLQMREDKTNRIIVANLTELRPKDADEVKEMVLLGNSRRTQSATHANETSSRSHAVLQINVAQTPRTASTTEERTMATLSIIDLAGSERASATKNMGERMLEGANINKSLLALGNCINALCESGNRTRHVPYRNSKLTRLLKFSLGGNCKTVMIVCVAPTSAHYEDTQNTLKYANRAKDIKTKVSRNFINVNRHVAQYVEAINRLNCEVAELKAKLAGKIGVESDAAKRKKIEAKSEMDRVRADIQLKSENNRASAIEGGVCEANITAAKSRVDATRVRLGQLEALAAESPLPSDLDAERVMLQSLAAADEATLRKDSTVNQRLARASNANSLFDAMLRAVSERRSDRLDDVMLDTIKTDVKLRRAELDHVKAQARETVLQETVVHQAAMISNLVGMLARCTVMMRDGGVALEGVAERMGTADGSGQAVQAVTASLVKIAESNDKTFEEILGQSTAAIAAGKSSSLYTFTGHVTRPAGPRRSSSLGGHTAGGRVRRRSSTVAPVAPSPARRRPSAIRKSLIQPQRLFVNEASKQVEKKALRWKDQVGEGDLDDGGANPARADSRASSNVSASEMDWEDEPTNKTEDSFNVSAASSSTVSESRVPPQPAPKVVVFAAPPIRKARGGRLAPTLGALTEVENESLQSPARPAGPRVSTPLGERSNRPESAGPGTPKGKRRETTPPPASKISVVAPRRVPGSARKKRLSNVGPVRLEKPRRRSSLIPKLSPKNGGGNVPARQAVSDMKSPMKKKRLSALNIARGSLATSTSTSNLLVKRPWRPSLSVRLAPIVSSPGEGGTARKVSWK